MEKSSSSKYFIWAAGLMALASLVVHSILYSHYLDLHFGEMTGPQTCDINSTFNCSAVTASKYAAFLGIPVALWGFAANFGFLALLALWPFTEEQRKPAAKRNLLIVAGFIALGSLVMGSISSFVIGKGCLYCMSAYLLSFFMFAAVWLGTRNVPTERSFNPKDFFPVLMVALIGFVGVFIADDSIKRTSGSEMGSYEAMEKAVLGFITEWQANPQVNVQTLQPLVKGPAANNAKMTIVEWADFRCPHCKHAAPVLKAFSDAHPDVRFEFQAWPLDGECNSAMQSSNGASCLLARVVWCGEKMGGLGWQLHEAIYSHEEPFLDANAIYAALPELLKGTPLDPKALRECADSDEMRTQIRKMADLGTALNLKGTPTIFANGKLLPGGQTLPVLTKAYELSSH